MKNKIYTAFDQIHAEDALKQKALESVFEYMYQHRHHSASARKKLFAFSAILLCMCIGFTGHQFFFKEAFALSVDVNPSIELGINRLDKVISVQGYNTEAEGIISSVNIKCMKYDEAIDCIVEEERRCGYLVDNDEVSITVDCPKEKKFQEINHRISTCKIQEKQTVSIDQCQNDTVKEAHENGMSFGKYKATLQLQEVNPCVTIEAAKDMSMKDIKSMTNGTPPPQDNTQQTEEVSAANTTTDTSVSTSQTDENKPQSETTSHTCLCKDNCTCSSQCTTKETASENQSLTQEQTGTSSIDNKSPAETSDKTVTTTSEGMVDKPVDTVVDTTNTPVDSSTAPPESNSTITDTPILSKPETTTNADTSPAPNPVPTSASDPVILQSTDEEKDQADGNNSESHSTKDSAKKNSKDKHPENHQIESGQS